MQELIAELRTNIVEALKLEEVEPESIDPDAPLFGDGLGLDSIDALELVVMVERCYGLKIKSMETGKTALASVSALADFIQVERGSA